MAEPEPPVLGAEDRKPPANILLAGIVGSTAYGLQTASSDIDRLGCYAAPTAAFHGLHPPTGKAATWVSTKPDAVYHEAGKLASLLLKMNPTVTEILWLEEYETETALGRDLIAIRSSLLSARPTRDAYLGYATQQFKRIENRGDGSFDPDLRNRTAKHARHLRRLLYQGSALHQTGRLTVRLTPDEAADCRWFGERVEAGDLDIARYVLADAEADHDVADVVQRGVERFPAGVAGAPRVRGATSLPSPRGGRRPPETPAGPGHSRTGRSTPPLPRTGGRWRRRWTAAVPRGRAAPRPRRAAACAAGP